MASTIIVDKIQKMENENLDYLRRQVILLKENELEELEMYLLNRKELYLN